MAAGAGLTGRPAAAAAAGALVGLAVLAGCRVPQAAPGPAAGGPAPAAPVAATAASAPLPPVTTATGPARAPTTDPAQARIALETVATGLDKPVDVKAVDPSGLLAVVEKAGRVRLVGRRGLMPGPFLDIRPLVGSSGSEQGLLGLAFHPRYGRDAGERRFFVHYTDREGDTVVAEYRAAEVLDRADPTSARVLLTAEQPAANHNGGHLAFGPDGFLYIGLGDGGGAGDRYEQARAPGTLLGKILRIDVDRGAPYAVPVDNPFVDRPPWRPEIWAWGLRNPWKFGFDRATGDLYVADVGQGDWEEVNFQPAAGWGGQDYGWPLLEGNHCYGIAGSDCDPDGATVRPVVEYAHEDGNCSVTGGYVYRGPSLRALVGAYLFGDYCSGRVWAAWRGGSAGWRVAELADTAVAISAFGEGADGELYVADYGGGALLRLVDSDGPRRPTPPAKRPVAPGASGAVPRQFRPE